MEYRIEDAKPEDAKPARTIVKNAWLKLYPNEKYGITAEDIASIDWYSDMERREKETIDNSNIHIWVIKNKKDKIVGFCKVTRSKNEGEINGMYVTPELQGRGWGKQLMQRAFDWLGNINVKLKVVEYNANAIEFYKKMGFQITGNKVSYEGTKLPNGKEIPRIEMLKRSTL